MKRSSSLFFFSLLVSPLLVGFNLEGRIRLEGKPPESAPLEVEAKHHADCGEKKISPKLKVSPEGGVANAVVKLESAHRDRPLQGAVPGNASREFILDQIQCEFSPHVQLLPKGAELKILNSDGFLHDVRAFDESASMLFNDAMPKKGQVLKKRFDRPGRILVRCGLHHWMHAIVVVQEHPYYALTDESGHFKIEGIPEGNYQLNVWQESLGEIKTEVKPDASFLSLTYPAQTD